MQTRDPIFLVGDTTVRSRLNLLLSIAAWQAILVCVFLSMWIGQYPETAIAGVILHWAGIVGCVWMSSRAILPRAGESSGELLFSGLVPLLFSGAIATGCYFAEQERFAALVAFAGHGVLLAALIRNYSEAGRELAAERATLVTREVVGDSWKQLLEGSVGRTVLLSASGVVLISAFDGSTASSQTFPPHRSFLVDVHPEDLAELQTHLRDTLTTTKGPAEPIRFRYRFPDGIYRRLETPMTRIDTSEFRGVVLHLRDITQTETLAAERVALIGDRDRLDAQKDRLLIEQKGLADQRDRLQAESHDRLRHIDSLNVEIGELHERAELRRRELEEATVRVRNLGLEVVRYQSNIDGLHANAASLDTDLTTLREAHAAVSDRLLERTGERDSTGQLLAAAKDGLAASADRIEIASREAQELRSELEKQTQQVSKLHTLRSDLERETANLNRTREELQSQNLLQKTTLDSLRIERERIAGELEAARGNLDRTFQTLEQTRELARVRQTELETESQSMERRLVEVDRVAAVGHVTKGVAAEFGNLLVGIMGNVSLARKQVSPTSEAAQLLGETETAAMHASDLCRQLSPELSPIAAVGNLSPEAVLRDAHSLWQLGAGRDHKLTYDLQPTRPIDGDAVSLRQVVLGMIRQAGGNIDASAARSGSIHLRVTPHDSPESSTVRIEVEDDGAPLTSERAEAVVRTTLLAAVRIVRSFKGRIELVRTESGNSIRVDLPVSASEVRERATVLMIDADNPVLTIASRILTSQGFTPLVARSVSEALDRFRDHPGAIAKVVLDLDLPTPGSAELIERLKELRPDILIVLTGHESEAKAREAIPQAVSCGYLRKPWRPEELIGRLRS